MVAITTARPAGEFRHKVQIEERSALQDAFGQRTYTWAPVGGAVWGAIEQLSGRQLIAAQAVKSEVTHRLVVRWRADLNVPVKTAAMRAVFRGRIFEIHACQNVADRDREIELLVSEGLTEG